MKSLQIAAIHHIPWLEDRHTLSDGRVCIRLTTAVNEFDAVTLRHAFHYAEGEPFAHATDIPMERMWRDENREVWQAVFAPRDPRIVYAFILRAGDVTLLHDADGTRAVPENPAWVSGFHYAHAYPAKEKPQWARGCVGYQIFPDRFRRVDVPGEEAVEPWGSKRVANEYRFGGNLKGILEAVPYLAELGVGVVYMTPIFLSDTSHRYNTFDYYQIDPLLGSLEDLRNLADALHARNIRIVLDGVFNHCGLGFAPFRDAMEKGKASEYYDWFFFGAQYPCGYMTFGEKWAYMPKLNMQNEACAAYFLDVGRYWLREAHVDGWRLDVSPEVYPDFWRQFRRAVLQTKPDAIMIAECWHDSREWCTVGDMFGAKDTARCGLELSYDSILRGTDGITHRRKVLKNYMSVPVTPPVNGADIITTIDVTMQDIAERSLIAELRKVNGDIGAHADPLRRAREGHARGGVFPDDASRRAGDLLRRRAGHARRPRPGLSAEHDVGQGGRQRDAGLLQAADAHARRKRGAARGHAQNVGGRRGRPVCLSAPDRAGDGAVRAQYVRTGDSPDDSPAGGAGGLQGRPRPDDRQNA